MLDTALKEWQAVCELLGEGQACFLLRKGGILEERGPGRFEVAHKRFLLFPSWAHQKPQMVKPQWRDRAEALDEPAEVTFHWWAEVTETWQVPRIESLAALDDLHPWTDEYVQMRWAYRPENPLYLITLRVHRLTKPKTIENRTEYGGCRSWVPLDVADQVDMSQLNPVLDDHHYHDLLVRIEQAMHADAQSAGA